MIMNYLYNMYFTTSISIKNYYKYINDTTYIQY